MIKNWIIAFLSLAVAGFILCELGVFDDWDFSKSDERSQHAEKRSKTVRKTPGFVIGSVYNSKDIPAAESVKGALIASEILQAKGMKIKYITVSNCQKRPETAAELQKLCADHRTGAVLGPGNSEMLVSLRAISQFYALPLISPVTVRPDKLPPLEHDNYVSFFPPLEKWVNAILAHMKENNIKKILIITPGNGAYGEIFSSVLERNSKEILNDFQVYRMTYPHPLRVSYFNNTLTNYGGQHKVDAIFFGGIAEELPELIQILKNHHIKLPVYVSDDIIRNEIKVSDSKALKLFLPEAEVPVTHSRWLELFVRKYKTQPSYHGILGAETMFAMAAAYDRSTYTPESFVRAMEQASKALNEKIKIKIIDFSSGKL
jgi:ABC-type branched-subunit amino acid transport system substrate-binding protein